MTSSRNIHVSENGDRWDLLSDADGQAFIRHTGNVPSGGHVSDMEVGAFLADARTGPEHQALRRLLNSLVDEGEGIGGETPKMRLTEVIDEAESAAGYKFDLFDTENDEVIKVFATRDAVFEAVAAAGTNGSFHVVLIEAANKKFELGELEQDGLILIKKGDVDAWARLLGTRLASTPPEAD
jgi:hypothetical protein